MHDIFISYAREDRARAELVAHALEADGWRVWWDRSIPVGRNFDDVIEEAIDAAKCIVVLWSGSSISSSWVRTEAGEGLTREVLIPDVTPPLAFRRVQTANLVSWDGHETTPAVRSLFEDIERLVGPPPRVEPSSESEPGSGHPAGPATPTPASGSGPKRETRGRDERNQRSDTLQGLTAPTIPRNWLKPLSIGVGVVAVAALGWQFRPMRPPVEEGSAPVEQQSGRADEGPAPGEQESGRADEGSAPLEQEIRRADQGPAPGEQESTAVDRPPPPRLAVDPLNNPIWIEAGTFRMGSTSGYVDETPVHQVTVSGFWIQEHEVTNAEYRRFEPSHEFPSGEERYPVVGVTWQQAMDYAESRGGRLPTEAEWEFAARGVEGRTYPWGNAAPDGSRANFGFSSEAAQPAGSYPAGATPEGVHDLAGNVWEWVADWFGSYDSSQKTDPTGPETGESRVIRGGSFYVPPLLVRGAYRNKSAPGRVGANVGFRVAWPGGQ